MRHLIENLDTCTALAGNDSLVVEARHHYRTALAAQLTCNLFAAFGQAVVEDDLGAVRPRAFHLNRRGIGRHDDGGVNAEPLGGDGDALSVIARRESDHAPLPLVVRELEEPICRTAQLE